NRATIASNAADPMNVERLIAVLCLLSVSCNERAPFGGSPQAAHQYSKLMAIQPAWEFYCHLPDPFPIREESLQQLKKLYVWACGRSMSIARESRLCTSDPRGDFGRNCD